MCCHRLFIYATCGHSTFALRPLVECCNAGIAPDAFHSSECELVGHPYKAIKLDKLCPPCQWRRDSMLERVERCQQLEFEEYKWRVSYAMPAHGKDYWTKKMEEKRAKEEAEAREEGRNSKKRFSWRRKSKKEG